MDRLGARANQKKKAVADLRKLIHFQERVANKPITKTVRASPEVEAKYHAVVA